MALLADVQRSVSGRRTGPFLCLCAHKIEYAIDRFALEVKRQLDVLNRRLSESECSPAAHTIADMAIRPWYGGLAKGVLYDAGEFFCSVEGLQACSALGRFDRQTPGRPAATNGQLFLGELSSQLHERHDAADFETNTEDKLASWVRVSLGVILH